MKTRYTIGRLAGITMSASLLGAAVGFGGVAGAFSGNPHYSDLSNLTPLAQRAAISLYEEGIMNGTAPGRFSAYGAVTRAQAVKFVVNALHLARRFPAQASFNDVTSQSPYYGWVEAAQKAGLFDGWVASATFGPSRAITRVDLAVLATNALHEQSLAASLASDTSTYGYLHDLGRVPAADLGAVNAMMKEGVVPPVTATSYLPFATVNRDEFAVAIMRLYAHLSPLSGGAIAAATLSAANKAVTVGTVDPMTLTVTDNGSSHTVTGLPYRVGWSISGGPANGASVNNSGVFKASMPGTYTVHARVSRGALPFPVNAHTTVTVSAAPASKVAGLALNASNPAPSGAIDIPYDSQETLPITVQLLDAAGNALAQAGVHITLTVRANQAAASASMAGATAPYILTTDANGRVHASFALTSSAGTIWTVIASSSGVSAATQTYRVVATVPASATIALKDTTTGTTTTAVSGNKLTGTVGILASDGKAIAYGDVVEITASPVGALTADPTGNVLLTFTTGYGATLVPGSHDQYFVHTNAKGQVAFTATAGQAGVLTVRVSDVSVPTPVSAQAQMTISK